MYKIAIIFRKTAQPNIFRELILKALSSDFSDYLICSAFFQETPTTKKPFSTSQEITTALSTANGNLSKINKNIDIYGLYTGSWNKQFATCCKSLKSYSTQNNGIKFRFFKFKNRSHAKIFYAYTKENEDINKDIKLAIIGSSNLSAGAFANRSQKERWNHESDVIFWKDDGQSIAKNIVDEIFNREDIKSSYSIIITDYDEDYELNDINSITDRLLDIEKLFSNHAEELFDFK